MKRILIPVGDIQNSKFAIRHVVSQFMQNSAMEIYLINVQPKFSRHIGRFVSKQTMQDWYQNKSELALTEARKMLESQGIPHHVSCKTGEPATVIANEAKRLHCDQIVLGTARKNSLMRLFENSTINQLIENTHIPVEIISGESVSRFERWAIPTAGAGLIATFFGMLLD
jgi:nucleotide-binding universal stress UspA family protein